METELTDEANETDKTAQKAARSIMRKNAIVALSVSKNAFSAYRLLAKLMKAGRRELIDITANFLSKRIDVE